MSYINMMSNLHLHLTSDTKDKREEENTMVQSLIVSFPFHLLFRKIS